MVIKMFRTLKNVLILLLTAISVYFCIAFPDIISNAVKEAVDRCLYVIIPSMFVFMCITCFISDSGMHSFIGIPFRLIAAKIFRVTKEGFAVFILSMISGYPAGIKLISENLSKGKISPSQAMAMSCYCYASGPAFIMGVTHILYPGSNAGVLLFLSVTLGNIITAFIISRSLAEVSITKMYAGKLNSGCLAGSIKKASSAMLTMCVMIVAFGGVSAVLKLTGLINLISFYTSEIFSLSASTTESILLSLLEISNIFSLPPLQIPLFPVTAFLLSFGGLCVHMQIYALACNNFSFRKFFSARIFSSSVSAFISAFLCRFLDIDISCNAVYKTFSEAKHAPAPSVFLLIMIILLLLSFNDKKTSLQN